MFQETVAVILFPEETMDEIVVGFDLGGTKMISAVLDRDLRILSREKKNTHASSGSEAVFERILATIRGSVNKAGASRLMGVGIASPGPLDVEKGIVLDTPNISFQNFPLRQRLEKELKVPVCLENDVSAGTFGEYKMGAARGFRHVVGIFPGTGIGGGIILDGKLFHGATGNAGEIGHMIIQTDGPLCGCGQFGCVESLASRTALSKDALALAAAGGAPTVFSAVGTDFAKVKSGVLGEAVKKGDKKIKGIIERSARFLGIAMANCVNILNPEAFILGGGLVEKLGRFYVQLAAKSMRVHSLPPLADNVKVLPAELGDDAVLLGAALLIQNQIGWEFKPQ